MHRVSCCRRRCCDDRISNMIYGTYVSQNRCKLKCFLWTVETSYETSTIHIRKLRVRNKTITLDKSSTATAANVALNYIRVNWIEATARKSMLTSSSIRHNIVTKSHPWFDVEHEPRPLFCLVLFCILMYLLLSIGMTIDNRMGRSTCVYIYLSIRYERLCSMFFRGANFL